MDGPAQIARRRGVESEVFERFYREHFATAYRGLLRLGVARDDCEDAAQDVFVAAHRRWHAFDGAVPRHAWLLGIVRRIAWRHRRTDGRRHRRHEALAHALRSATPFDDGLARREASRLLTDFLSRLDDARREAFVLGELESLGRVELGAALGVNPNTAYSRLQSARRSFFAHFAALDDDGCARVIVGAEHDESPDAAIQARAWAMLLPALGQPTAALASAGLGAWAGHALGGHAVAIAIGAVVSIGIAIGIATSTERIEPAVLATAPLEPVPQTAATTAAVVAATPPRAVAPSLSPSGTSRDAEPVVVHPSPVRRPPQRELDAQLAMLAASPSTLQAELVLLQRARAATLVGDTATARRWLAEHADRYGETSNLQELRASIARDLESSSITGPRSGDGSAEE